MQPSIPLFFSLSDFGDFSMANPIVFILVVLLLVFVFIPLARFFVRAFRGSITWFVAFFMLSTFMLGYITPVMASTEGTVISEVVNGHTTYFFSVKGDDNINKWYELDFDRLQIDVYVNGSCEAVITVFWDDYWVLGVTGINYMVTITNPDDGSKARTNTGDAVAIFGIEASDGKLKIMAFGDYNYKAKETYKAMLEIPTINYPYNLTVTFKRYEGNEEWHVDFLEKSTQTFNWAEEPHKSIWQVLYEGVKSLLPADAQETLDNIKDTFVEVAGYVKNNGLSLIGLGFTIYGLGWAWHIVLCIKTLNPTPLLEFVYKHVDLVRGFASFMINVIKTIVQIIGEAIPF